MFFSEGFKWFITTDSENLLKKLIKSDYRKKLIYVNESIGHISHVEYDSRAYFRTIIDNELLSRCDKIIITGGSTFGKFIL